MGLFSNKSKHGHRANKPIQISLKEWKDILLRVNAQIVSDHILIVSAGVAFYFFLAFFPTLVTAISLYGLLVDPAEVQKQMVELAVLLPQKSQNMVRELLNRLAGQSHTELGWGMGLSVLISLFSAKKRMAGIFQGINIAYNEVDDRNLIFKNLLHLLFMLAAIIIGIITIAIVAAWPALVDRLYLPSYLESLIGWGRWPVLALIVMLSLGLIYKLVPNRRNPKLRWVSWGAVIATLLWLAGSMLFSVYVENFANYDRFYGSFAAVIILLLWFLLTAFIILLGAEINSEMEHQILKDSTVGKDKPMGQRGAYHADHVAWGDVSGKDEQE